MIYWQPQLMWRSRNSFKKGKCLILTNLSALTSVNRADPKILRINFALLYCKTHWMTSVIYRHLETVILFLIHQLWVPQMNKSILSGHQFTWKCLIWHIVTKTIKALVWRIFQKIKVISQLNGVSKNKITFQTNLLLLKKVKIYSITCPSIPRPWSVKIFFKVINLWKR